MIRDGKMRYHDDLGPLMVDIDAVEPAPYNYNNGDVEMIAESIEQNGMYRPIFAQRSTGHIIAGNHTWLACKTLEATKVPLVWLDVDDVTAKRIMVEDNEIARRALPDSGLLLSLLTQIKDETGHLTASFSEQDYETLRLLNEIPLDTDEFGQWPTFTVQVPPHVLQGFMHLTREADTDRARFELLMRMAGWEG